LVVWLAQLILSALKMEKACFYKTASTNRSAWHLNAKEHHLDHENLKFHISNGICPPLSLAASVPLLRWYYCQDTNVLSKKN
jgi:hypothetical protein